jgi:ribosomal protein S12 methylthiotransferase accessory factor
MDRILFLDERRPSSAPREPFRDEGQGDSMSWKGYRRGTDRVVDPEITLDRVRPVMAAAGITRVANVTGLDRIGMPVVAVCRPNARSVAVSQGKGLTLAAAKASGIMEALECFHAETTVLPLRLGTAEEMRRDAEVIDTDGLPAVVGSRFGPRSRILWAMGRDLVADREVLAPYEVVHTDYRVPFPTGSGCFLMSSNGLASGNHQLEAISHGICELVERDANTLWKCGTDETRAQRRVALKTIDAPDCLHLLALLDDADLEVSIWDTTSDVGLPAFWCQIADRRGARFRPLAPISGSGCHPRKQIALSRALTEAAQGRATIISGSRDDLTEYSYDEETVAARLDEFERQRQQEGPRRNFGEIPSFQADTIEEDVAFEVARLRAVGVREVVVFDLTRQEFGVPVVRVAIPGLEPMSDAPGYLPGLRAMRSYREARQ